MSNQVVPFAFEQNPIRTIAINGEIWFVAQDVLKSLEYSTYKQPAKIIQHIPDEWKGMNPIHTLGGKQDVSIISEQGLYFLLGRSDKPKALPFQKWLAGEVLPAIRRTGQYRQQPELDFTDVSAMKSAREIAFKYFDDLRDAVKAGRDSAPMDDIPADVLAGMVSAALRSKKFILHFDYNGQMHIRPMPNPYDGLAKAIADPGNIGLEDQVISEIGHACMTALACRAKSRKAVIGRTRSGDAPQR